jgi:cytochrome P450
MVSLDPPAHSRLRGPAQRAFTPGCTNAMIPAIQTTLDELREEVADQPRFDLVAALAILSPPR